MLKKYKFSLKDKLAGKEIKGVEIKKVVRVIKKKK